jgi:hypothetical protein
MKSLKLFLLITAAITLQTNAMENSNVENQQSKEATFCPLLKKINPEAPDIEYKKLAQTFQQHGVSACICTNYLLELKREKAEAAVRSEWNISHKSWDTLKSLQKILYNESINENKTDPCVHVSTDKSIPNPVMEQIIHNIAQNQIHQKAIIQKTDAVCAGVQPNGVFNASLNDNDGGDVSFSIRSLIFYPTVWSLSEPFIELNREQRQAVIEHEIEHLKRNHGWEKSLAYSAATLKQANLQQTQFFDSSSMLKLSKLQEYEADLYPAACKASVASALHSFFKNNKSSEIKTHPHPQKRENWVLRLSKLKKAEEQLNSQEKE